MQPKTTDHTRGLGGSSVFGAYVRILYSGSESPHKEESRNHGLC